MLNPTPQSRLNIGAQVVLFLLRVAVGWHLLYEGVTKFEKNSKAKANAAVLAQYVGEQATQVYPLPGQFTAKEYLAEATGPMADLFRRWAEDTAMLKVMDTMVVFGLVACGGCLILGLFTRLAGLGAMGMLAMFYISQPPYPMQQTTAVKEYPLPSPVTLRLADGGEVSAKVEAGKLATYEGKPLPAGSWTAAWVGPDADVPAIRVNVVKDGRVLPALVAQDRFWVQEPVALSSLQIHSQRLPAFALPGATPIKKGPTEGNYLYVNKNLVELLAVLLMLLCNAGMVFGLDALVRRYVTSRFFGGNDSAAAHAAMQAEAARRTVESPESAPVQGAVRSPGAATAKTGKGAGLTPGLATR